MPRTHDPKLVEAVKSIQMVVKHLGFFSDQRPGRIRAWMG
jgi:hypothetical protein